MTSPEQVKANAENAMRKAASDLQWAPEEQQAMQNRLKAAQRDARAQPQQMPDATKLNAYDLARLCESKGMDVDHLSNTGVPMGGLNGGGGIAVWERPVTPPTNTGGAMPTVPSNAGDPITACGAKGYTVDFVTGNCVSPHGQQANPQNLYPPFAAPLPNP